MKKIIKVQQPSDAPFNLTWLSNNICPNACSYCPSELHSGQNHHYDWNNAKDFLEILFSKYSKIHCSVSGGEPTVSPFFKSLVKTFYEANHTIGITTNGYRTVRYWEEISPQLNYICFSYHPQFHDDQFISKVKIASSNTFVSIRVMMLPTMWDHCVSMFHHLSLIDNTNIEPVRIVNWGGIDNQSFVYTPTQLQWFQENPGIQRTLSHFTRKIEVPDLSAEYIFNDGSRDPSPNAVVYVNRGLTNFYGYECEIGLKGLFVHWSGDIYRGNCLDGGIIGNINDPNNIQWPRSTITCSKLLCYCSSDININKWIS